MNRQEIFRSRLSLLVDWLFDGNVNRAAEELDVYQPTLHKILSGGIRESKSSTIADLASRLGVPEPWLRGDTETLITPPQEGGSYIRWYEALMLYHRHREAPYREAIASYQDRS